MLSKLCLVAVIVSLCACARGQIQPPADTSGGPDASACLACPVNPPPVPAPVNPYMNSGMVGQVWTFHNAAGTCATQFALNGVPASDYYAANSIMLTITKPPGPAGAPCYWLPTVPDALINFMLQPMGDGSYNSPGWVIYFPTVLPPWVACHATPCSEQVQPLPGGAMPYLIVPPPTLTAGDYLITETMYDRWDQAGEDYNSFVVGVPMASVYWKTMFYMSPDGLAVSEQWEGDCGHERWYFQAGAGLVRIEAPNDGHGTGANCAGQAGDTISR